jgi:hypothetical protein
MADYTAIFSPGSRITMTASGAIVGGDLLVIAGSGLVAKAAALASTLYIGIAGHDAASGTKLAVIICKVIHESIADGTVTAGDLLTTTATANRQVKTLLAAAVAGAPPLAADINTVVNASRAIVGIAITTASDNTLVRWAQW